MEYLSNKALKEEIDKIIQDYLYRIMRDNNFDLFKKYDIEHANDDIKTTFQIINPPDLNHTIVNAEALIDGCTRVFLINHILDTLFRFHGIDIEWINDSYISKWRITTREYELNAILEFIVNYNGEKIGYRYTQSSFSGSDTAEHMENYTDYALKHKPIPWFKKLSPIDKVVIIDWSIAGHKNNKYIHDVPFKTFFNTYFKNYDLFISLISDAVQKAKKIIALQAVPQLNRQNIFAFKQNILIELSEEIKNLSYDFNTSTSTNTLNEMDTKIIDDRIYNNNLTDALIGCNDFSKSFLTSEYLFRTLKNNLCIDYTAVITGYLKSVEQLLYLYYISAFKEEQGIEYWDTWKFKKGINNLFDDSQISKFRIDPYDNKIRQEYYYHKKKSGNKAPSIGELVNFVRYYEPIWNISENGKEYIISCLNNFCSYCRNHHFHKDNIVSNDFETVVRIRNNAYVCIRFILGGFNLLNEKISIKNQLGILDYSFEKIYQKIYYYPWLRIKTQDGYDGNVFYYNRMNYVDHDEYGRISEYVFHFVKADKLLHEVVNNNTTKKQYEYDEYEYNELLKDENYISKNSIIITRDNLPSNIQPIRVKIKEQMKIL